MDFSIGYKHYRLLKFCFFATGLTPYKPTLLSIVHTTIVCLILLIGQTLSISFLVKNNICLSQFFSSQVGVTVLTTTVNITYGLLLVKSVNTEEWFKYIKRDWNHMQDKEEFKILKTHVAMGNQYTNIYIIAVCTLQAGYLILSIVAFSVSHRIFSSTNKILCYIPIDPMISVMLAEKSRNYYLSAILRTVTNILIIAILYCRDVLFLLTILHIHGLYEIAMYHMKNAVDRNSIEMAISKKDIVIRNKIINSMKIFNLIIKWIKYLKHNFSFSCLLTFVVMSMYLTLIIFNISRTIFDELGFLVIINFAVLVSAGMLCTKIFHLIQCIFDESQKFFYTPYTVEWYNLSLTIQKLLLFIMRGNHHSAVLNLYGIWIPTFETLGMQFKLSWSYFMALHSTQK